MKKGGDSGKAYHVKKERKRQKKRDKELRALVLRTWGLKGGGRTRRKRK